MQTPVWKSSIGAVLAAYRSGELRPGDVVQACLARAAELTPQLKAFAELWPEAAAARAARLEAEGNRDNAPLWGIPLAHKDIFARPDRQPGCGVARELPGSALPASPLLHRLEAAGAVDLGVLNLAEFALGTTGSNARLGDAGNPWDPARCTGGSSSGSAAAVSAGLAFASLGTDSGASVRVPAALCGIVGYMPAHGTLDTTGCFPLSWSVDRPGVLARTVVDCALVCDIARGRTPAAPERPDRPLRIGIPQSYYTDHLSRPVADAYQAAIRYCESLGHRIVEVPVVETVALRSLHRAIMRTEAAAVHRRLMAEHPEFYDLPVRKFITGGEGIFALDYVDALRLRASMQRESLAVTYSSCDLILTPTAPSLALRYDDIADAAQPDVWRQVTGLAHFTQPASYLGLPAISVPFTLSSDMLPIGFQLIAPPAREAELLSMARQFETHWAGLDPWPPHAA